MVKELGGQEITIVPSTVGKIKPQGTPEEEWQLGRRQPEAVLRPRPDARASGSRIEPLNRFETYFLNRHDQALALAKDGRPRVRRLPRRVPHEHRREGHVPGDPQLQGPPGRLPRRRQQPHGLRHGRTATGAKIIGTLKEIGYDGALTVEFVAPVDRTPANPYPNALEKGPVEPHARRAEVHRGPRQQHALGRVLHVARRRDDQDARGSTC